MHVLEFVLFFKLTTLVVRYHHLVLLSMTGFWDGRFFKFEVLKILVFVQRTNLCFLNFVCSFSVSYFNDFSFISFFFLFCIDSFVKAYWMERNSSYCLENNLHFQGEQPITLRAVPHGVLITASSKLHLSDQLCILFVEVTMFLL